MENTAGHALYDLLVTRDFEPELLDSSGKPVSNPDEAELFSFDWKTENQNYGTVVVLLGEDNELEVYFGDNLGRTMESDDKSDWYDFLHQMKQFATRNLLTFEINNINRLKYTMQGMAAIKEGLFEGYYGKKRTSYSDQPKATRLRIAHNRDLGEGEARFRAIDKLFVETADGEVFKVPTKSLTHGRMLARHCAEGGNPYDAFGQHINQMVSEMNTLSRFIRAARSKGFDGDAGELVEAAVRHYSDLKAKARHMISQRGYREERDNFDPALVTDSEMTTEAIRNMFIEQSLDSRIEEALPVLARLAEEGRGMKEANEFECWANDVMEGTWALPDTPEAQRKLADLMSTDLIAGADGTNATEQLYDLVGDDILFDIIDDIANTNPDANVWDDPRIVKRMAELGVQPTEPTNQEPEPEEVDEALQGAPIGGAMGLNMNVNLAEESVEFKPVKVRGTPGEGRIHEVGTISSDLLPGFVDDSTPGEYSSSYYYQDPKTGKVFVAYTNEGHGRIRGLDGMPEQRVAEIARMLGGVSEDLDTDGVMMTRPSNMSSESLERIKKLALI